MTLKTSSEELDCSNKLNYFQAKALVSEFNCGPSELKERFLNVMQKLDEYTYIITDFNLAMAQTGE